jgi:hypothetical protein
MSQSIRTVLTAVAATVSLACLTAPAFAQTQWQANHPRRVHQEVKSGQISRAKAARLHASDHRIRMQERRMASRHDSHLTRREDARLNREENHVSRRIGQ